MRESCSNGTVLHSEARAEKKPRWGNEHDRAGERQEAFEKMESGTIQPATVSGLPGA